MPKRPLLSIAAMILLYEFLVFYQKTELSLRSPVGWRSRYAMSSVSARQS
jgi:hypothetical protein